MKIKTFEKLIKELNKLCKKDKTLSVSSRIYDYEDEDSYNQYYDWKASKLVYIVKKKPNYFGITKENTKGTFWYYDGYFLEYINDKGKNIHILDWADYNEVYNFLYNYYFCSLNINKDKYEHLNNIFRRK